MWTHMFYANLCIHLLCKPLGSFSKYVGSTSEWIMLDWVEVTKLWGGWIEEES